MEIYPRMNRDVGDGATYKGLVWQTRRGLTLETKRIDALVSEWETTSVDFKRELHLDTEDQKAEFIKDILGLVNTQSSGKRYLIIGFDDKTRTYYGPPDPKISTNRMEQFLARLTAPVVQIRYDLIPYKEGSVGQIEVFRDPALLPYRVGASITGSKKKVSQHDVFVRHGSQTEAPTADELQALKDEAMYFKSKLIPQETAEPLPPPVLSPGS